MTSMHLLDLQGAADARGHGASQQIQAITFAAHVYVLGDLFKPVLVETSEWLFRDASRVGAKIVMISVYLIATLRGPCPFGTDTSSPQI